MPSAIWVCSVSLVKRRIPGSRCSLRAGMNPGRFPAGNQGPAGDVIVLEVSHQVPAPHGVEGFRRAGDGASQRLVRPEGGVEQFLNEMLGLVHIHGHFLLDHAPLFLDVPRSEPRIEKHVHQHVQQFVEAVVAGPGMEAGDFLAGKGIQVTADAFDCLRDFQGRPPFCSLEEQVFDEMADAIEFRRFMARAHAHPQAKAHAGHVRHLRRGDRQSVLEARDAVHFRQKPWTQFQAARHAARSPG